MTGTPSYWAAPITTMAWAGSGVVMARRQPHLDGGDGEVPADDQGDDHEPLEDPPHGARSTHHGVPDHCHRSSPPILPAGRAPDRVSAGVGPETLPGDAQACQYSLAPEHLQRLEQGRPHPPAGDRHPDRAPGPC